MGAPHQEHSHLMPPPHPPGAPEARNVTAPEASSSPAPGLGGRRPLVVLTLLSLLSGCVGEMDRLSFTPAESPRGRYAQALELAGLSTSALALDWTAAADSALGTPVEVSSPYAEDGFMDPAVPTALAYRVRLVRGQRLRVETELEAPDSTRLFVEVFRTDSLRGPERVLAPEPGTGPLEYEPRRGAELLVRVQPELLRGGRYRVTLVISGALGFPVEGRGMQSILSFFGDDREAGRRVHHGVDVFAPRGTPVLAVSDGMVTRVGDQRLGGNVVWVRDEAREINQYYAHLDTQLVEVGTRVQAGDTLGTVGNSGNARTTAPHLHFGLYQRGEGPVDPWFFLLQPGGEAPALALEEEALRGWVRTRNDGIRIRSTPTLQGAVVDAVAVGTPLEVMAGAGEWMRVRLPDGRGGFILGRLTRPARDPLTSVRAGDDAGPLRSLALPHAPVVGALDPGDGVDVLGSFGDFLLVRSPDGRDGWMSAGGVES